MAGTYTFNVDTFEVTDGTEGVPANLEDLNTWAQGVGGAAAAAITEIVAGAMYKLDAHLQIGDGSTSTWFTSLNEG